MANKTIVNTFTDAMNKDVDKSLLSNKSYLDAQNFRMITTKGNSTGSLETIKGNKVLATAGSLVETGQFIIGSCEIRDKIVLFTTDNTSATPSGGKSQIYTITVDLETEAQTAITLIYDDNLNYDGSYLNFSTANPIKAISRYETPNIQKVFWTDGYNNIRYINIATNLTVTGEAYNVTTNKYMTVDKCEFLPGFNVTKPVLSDIVGGKINTGVIAYSYQLYKMNGSTTTFSPLSDPIHVTNDSDFLDNTLSYGGVKESINSGKGFILSVTTTNNVGYDRLRLVRVEYSTLNSLPKIVISNEISISPLGDTVKITDTGDVLGELTIDEFNIASTELFKCQDLAIKDNILFASNIEKEEFSVGDWDARAVRFKAASTATVYDGSTPTVLAANLSDWVANYPLTHDGINQFNDPDHDGDAAYQWMYQADGTTIGAEGLNIKIDFETEAFYLDLSNDNETFYATKHSSGSDTSYHNYASPWKGGKLSWQRDEVYRLYVVFGNERGQTADPKWICDLRMPSYHDANFTNSSSNTVRPSNLSNDSDWPTTIMSHRLYPRIYFKNFPSGATWAQIHRVKRERKDRFVVSQCLAMPTILDGTHYYPGRLLDSTANLSTNGIELVKLVSPEINITRNISKQANDYLEYVTNYSGNIAATTYNDAFPTYGSTYKYITNTRVAFSSNCKTVINDTAYIVPALLDTDEVIVDGKTYINYIPGGARAKGSSGLLVSYDNESWSAEGVIGTIINYKSNVYGSQYGGHTYEDRAMNVSIPCSDVISYLDTATWIDIPYGDTYINFFDITFGLVDLIQVAGQPSTRAAYVPLESSINCDLRHDSSSTHLTYENANARLRQEYMGTHDLGNTGEVYEQQLDMYLYNTVYSQQLDVKYAISLDPSKILETEFDCMIKASKKKVNGEITDSWTTFGVNEFIEVDTEYGPINALKVFNNQLYYWQDRAFGITSVNERSLISDKAAAQIVLGTGGVLDRYDYMSQQVGSKDKFSIVTSLTGMYWYDRLSKSIYKYSDRLMNLTKTKYIQSYMASALDSTFLAIAHNDVNNDEILFTFYKNNETNGFTISFNEPVDAFVSFYGFVPTLYIPYQHRYLTTTSSYYCGSSFDRNHLFLHDSDVWDRCYFYALATGNSSKYVDSTLEILFNPEYEYTKVFDNLFYISNTASKTVANNPVKSGNIDTFADTFDTVQCYNDFQNTGAVTLTHKTNIERRERGWTLVVPRNIVSTNISSDPNIFTNVDSTQLFKERMRDKYLIAYFTYNNDGTYDRFTVSNMGLKYRTSYR